MTELAQRAQLSPVDPLSTQYLLTQDPSVPQELPPRRTHAPKGWYPDPTGSRRLRYFSGDKWTYRTRPAPHANTRHNVAVQLTNRLADRAARKDNGDIPQWAQYKVRVPRRARHAPSLTRRRSGNVVGMISLMSAIVALVAATVIGWGIWGTAWTAGNAQAQLSSELTAYNDPELVPGSGNTNLPATSTDIDLTSRELAEIIDPGAPPPDAEATWTDRLEQPANPLPVAEPNQENTSDSGSSGECCSWPSEPSSSSSETSSGGTTWDPRDIDRFDTPQPDITPFPPADFTPGKNRDKGVTLPKKEGKAVGRIRIPAIGVDAAMVAGTTWEALASGPGIWRYGAAPTQPGNATVAAHRNGWGEWFNQLDKLRYGDLIYVDMPGVKQAVYEVRGRLVVNPDKVSVTDHTDGVRLTLSTCHPNNSGQYRLIVQAEMISGPWVDKALNRSEWKLQY